jgi:hypothetical protein
MKTKITLFLVLLMSIHAMAQQIATFETGSTTIGTIAGAPADQQTEFIIGAANPDKTGLNTSDKCLSILSNQVVSTDVSITSPGRPDWDKNVFTIRFDAPVSITAANRYLHIMHHKQRMLNTTWLVFAENGNDTYVEIGRGSCPEAGKWFDIMVDFNGKLTSVRTIRVHLDGNWGTDPVTRFYEPTRFLYDDIVMNNNPLPRGTTTITRANLLDFENSTTTNSTITLNVQNAVYTTDLANANVSSSVNNSLTCAKFVRNSGTLTWWHGLHFTFKSPVDAGANQYLHIMMKKSVAETANINANLVNLSGTASATLIGIPLTTEWVDYVLTIPSTHTIFTQLYIKYNAQAVTTECFADEILLSTSATPRTSITTAMNHADANKYTLFAENSKITYKSSELNDVKIYSVSGQLVYSQRTTNLQFEAAQKGLYIVKINEFSQKLLVK